MIFERVCELIRSQLDVSGDITAGTDIIADLGVDSVDLAELVVLVEEEFSLPPTARAMQDIRTVGQLVALIESVKK
ncbi:MAG: acyl carrier protein [Candidatus Heteroscillospira sp.]|jgi:acyl carrier protein